MSKRKRRTYDGRLPLVVENPNGELSVEVSEDCRIAWRCVMEGDTERVFITVKVPASLCIHEIDDDSWLLHRMRQ